MQTEDVELRNTFLGIFLLTWQFVLNCGPHTWLFDGFSQPISHGHYFMLSQES